ncbi:MAG: RrF2 family transcriptional regulator [Desulfohalobiaceae bacterium]
MKLSTRSRYGTRLMLELAKHFQQGPVHLNDIAKRQNISIKYLEQLIIPLKKANLIRSVRGPRGGYQLNIHPKQIPIGQILQTLEGDLELTPCLKDPSVCERSEQCPTKDIWNQATQAMYKELDSLTIWDIVQKQCPQLDLTLQANAKCDQDGSGSE